MAQEQTFLYLSSGGLETENQGKLEILSRISIINSGFSQGTDNLLVTEHEEWLLNSKFTENKKQGISEHENTLIRPSIRVIEL